MLKLRSMISFLLLAIIVPYTGSASILPASSPFAVKESQVNKHYIIFEIDKVQFLGKTGDVIGDGEFRLLILMADTNGRTSGTFCPTGKPMSVKQGDTVNSPCLQVSGFDENNVSDGVYLTVIALDEDKSSSITDLPYEMATNKLGEYLGEAVAKKAFKVVAGKSNPYAFPIQVLVSYSAGKVKNWIEKADVVGTQGIYLSRQDNWSATGKAKTVTSSDDGIKITYTVTETTTIPKDEAKILGAQSTNPTKTPMARPAKTNTPSNITKNTAKISCANKIYFARLRKSAGYINKDDTTDTVVEIPCGETVKILGGPTKKDGLNWYQIAWNGQNGWMADHTSTGKPILLFSN